MNVILNDAEHYYLHYGRQLRIDRWLSRDLDTQHLKYLIFRDSGVLLE